MKFETRSGSPAEYIRTEGDHITVAGYAAVFNQETVIAGMFREVIQPGAFKKAIGRDEVVFNINHDGLPLARTKSNTLTISEDDHGLRMEATLDKNDPDVQRIFYKMQRGDLDEMSFAFTPDVESWDDTGDMPLRSLVELGLHDVSIVNTGAYGGTEIALRSLEKAKEQKKNEEEDAKREVKEYFRRKAETENRFRGIS